MQVYGLSGLPGSGKSEVGKIAIEHGFPVIRMGDMVWENVRKLGLPLEPEIVGRIAHQRRELEGPGIWASVTVEHINAIIESSPLDFIVIDGVRSTFEADIFRAEFDNFKLVAVHSSPRVRYNRIMARKRVDDAISYEAFMDRENRELSWGAAQVVALADIMLVNEGSLSELQERSMELFQG
jgi:dephospho-CoA kinase